MKMDHHFRPKSTTFDEASLATLMPMHLILDLEGRIISIGPTLQRLFAGKSLIGKSVFTVFTISAPAKLSMVADLRRYLGRKLFFVPRDRAESSRLRAVIVALENDTQLFVNLSFGFDVAKYVGELNLRQADFAPTDLTVEVLYLTEVKALIVHELQALSKRINGARLQAEERAVTDPLTGLGNRRVQDDALQNLCRQHQGFALVHIDLDHFKLINDKFGHAAGDDVLRYVSGALKSVLREQDYVARVGGDEFILVLPGRMSAQRLQDLGDKLAMLLNQPIPCQGNSCAISASLGAVIVAKGHSFSPEQLLKRADQALYQAKQAGKARLVVLPMLGD